MNTLAGETIRKGARISECGRYRYTLTRTWEARGTPCAFVMLNPSTADASVDDPTIRRCMGFARAFGYGSLSVVNLFAFRATSPADMKRAPDPVGPENDAVLAEIFWQSRMCGAPVIAAWGAHGEFMARDVRVWRIAEQAGVSLECLGRTAAGAPRHPLYLPASAQRIGYRTVGTATAIDSKAIEAKD